MYGKWNKIKAGTRKAQAINERINIMWRELEHTHNNSK